MQIGILEPKDFSSKALQKLKTIGDVEIYNNKNLNKFLKNKQTIFIRLEYFIDIKFLNKAKDLKYICTPTTGLNHINLKECKKRDIQIISLKDEYKFLSTIRATPEHTFGLVLSLLRNYKTAFLSPTNYKWDREKYKGFELYDNKIGIVGFGRIGKILAKYFQAFGTKVYFYDTDNSIKETTHTIKTDSITKLINKSNIIILSASYSKENFEFFNKEYIDLLKNKYFINTSRGELVSEKYLLKKIKEKFFAGVGLDVIQNEQTNNNLDKIIKLTNNKNFIVTSHIAGATYSSMYKTEEFIVQKLVSYTK